MKKYKIEKNISKVNDQGITLYRIRKIPKDPSCKGKLGGWVESKTNLSQRGSCWIYGEAEVSGKAQIRGDAQIWEHVKIRDEVIIMDNAKISGYVKAYESAIIKGNAFITGNVQIHGDVVISGDTHIGGNVEIFGRARINGGYISGNAKIHGHARISHFANISGDVEVYEHSTIREFAELRGKVKACGWSCIKGSAIVEGDITIDQSIKISYSINNNTLIGIIAGSLGIYPDNNGNYIMYKRVMRKGDHYVSYYNTKFQYRIGEISQVKKINLSNAAYASGIHLSTPFYPAPINKSNWALIQCQVNINDIITCQDGKIRCRKCLVLREVTECTMHT